MTVNRVRRIAITAGPLLSQIVSSLGNFAVVLLCARFLDPSAFGRFSLVYSAILFLSQVLRSAVGESAMISGNRVQKSDDHVARTMMSGGIAACVLFGVAGSVVAMAMGLSTPLAAAIGFCALVVPMADIARYVYIVIEPQTAVVIDFWWATGGVVAIVALRAIGELSEASMLVAWGGSAALASLRPVLRQAPRHFVSSLRSSLAHEGAFRLVFDMALLTGSSLALLGVLAARGGSAEVGVFRSAAIPFTWIQIAHGGGYLTVARRRNSATWVNRRTLGIVLLVGGVACAGTGLFLRLLPRSWGEAVFGRGWDGVSTLAVVVAFQYASFVLAETLMGAMKIRMGPTQVVRIRMVFAATLLAQTPVIAAFATARSTVLCLTAANSVIAALATISLRNWSSSAVVQRPKVRPK